jgi:hypothetical protein
MASQTHSATQSASPSFAARLREVMILHHAVTRVYDDAGNVIQTHEQAGDFKHWWGSTLYRAPFFLACLADLRSSFWRSRFS